MNIVSRQAALAGIVSSSDSADRAEEELLNQGQEIEYDAEKEEKRIRNKGLEEFYFHRKFWSWFILGWITVLLIFNVSLTVLIGLGYLRFVTWFDFMDMRTFVISVTVETFLQIVGLGYVATHYLFSSEKKLDKRQRAALFGRGLLPG